MEDDNTGKNVSLLKMTQEKRSVEVSDFKINLYEALLSPDRWNYSYKDEGKRLADVHFAKKRRAVERILVKQTPLPTKPTKARKDVGDIVIDFGDVGIEEPSAKEKEERSSFLEELFKKTDLAV